MNSFVNPKVLVTGHPNSGTSFLCELVAAMGFSPGDPRCLKPADGHNPHGYWEHVPLREHVRSLGGYSDWMHVTGGYPPEPLEFTPEEKQRTAMLFEGAGVEVFKETGLPVMYRLFLLDSAYLIIERDARAMYESQGSDYEERDISFDGFRSNIDAYQRLVSCMIDEVRCLVVHYEDFGRDFRSQASRIAEFVGATPDIAGLREIWRPRRGHAE
jgi:hypothetical protein